MAQGQRNLDAQHALAGAVVRDSYQQQNDLLGIAVLTFGSSLGDFQSRIHWSAPLFDQTAATLRRLQELQVELDAKKARQAEFEALVAKDRRAAAGNLKRRRSLAAHSRKEAKAVTALVGQARSARAAADHDVAVDKKQYAAPQTEYSSLRDHRLQPRHPLRRPRWSARRQGQITAT